MKLILALLLAWSPLRAAPREIDRGEETRDTKTFESKHPYTVTWSLTFPKPAFKGHEVDKTVSVFVYDAKDDSCVISKLGLPWDGSLKVPEGGKHYLWVSTSSDWIMRIEVNPPNPHDAVIRQLDDAAKDQRDREEADKRAKDLHAMLNAWGNASVARIKRAPQGPERDRVIKEELALLVELKKRLGIEDTEPMPPAKPSSVKGWPDGVEPAKNADNRDLPPGMTKGGAP